MIVKIFFERHLYVALWSRSEGLRAKCHIYKKMQDQTLRSGPPAKTLPKLSKVLGLDLHQGIPSTLNFNFS